MRIESYWFGYVVVSLNGTALSKAYQTEAEAQEFILKMRKLTD
jgi:hypothetical protein